MSIIRQTQILEGITGAVNGDIITDTSLHNGTWYEISALTDTVIATLAGSISGTAVSISASAGIRGRFTGITLTSGSVIAYDKI